MVERSVTVGHSNSQEALRPALAPALLVVAALSVVDWEVLDAAVAVVSPKP